MKIIKLFENWLKESSTNLFKDQIDQNLNAFLKTSPNKSSTEKILSCGAVIKINDYTGIKTTETDFVSFDSPNEGNGDGGVFQIQKDSSNKISIYFSLDCSTAYNVPSGEIFYIKFVDNSIMKFPTRGDAPNYSNGRFYHSVLLYPSTAQLEIMKKKKINGLKYDIQETDVPDKTSSLFITYLNCVISGKVLAPTAPETQDSTETTSRVYPVNTFNSRSDLYRISKEKTQDLPTTPNPIIQKKK